jgi:hypothetical protein
MSIFRFLIIFFYLFPVTFNFIPIGLTTRIYLSFFGFILLTLQIVLRKKFEVHTQLLKTIAFLSLFPLISISSLLFNSSMDIQFVFYPISLILIVFASYPILYFFNYNNEKILKYIVSAIVLQNIISLIMFISPSTSNLINSIQIISEPELLKMSELSEMRLLGFGSSYFGSGIINCFGLIVVTFLYLKSDIKRHRILYVLLFILIAFIGILKARTTFIGIILSILYIFISDWKKTISYVTLISIFIFTIGTILLTLVLKLYPDSDVLLQFGFEMFDNFFRYGNLESDSTNELIEMYQLPNELKTWFIGDGHWNSLTPGDFSYYKNTDVGYLRMIYYFGLMGTLFFVWFHIRIFKLIKFNEIDKREINKFALTLAVLFVILNFKGFADIFYLVIFFIFQKYNNESRKTASYSYSR